MITFTRDWRGYAKGSSVGTLAATMEALAVAEGAAVYGGVAGPLNSYLGRTNAVQAQVDGGGNSLPIDAREVSQSFLTTRDLTVDLDNLAVPVLLPNPYPSLANEPLHPSVLHFPSGWNGSKYWIAYTPYPSTNSDYENPTVAASNSPSGPWIAKGRQPLVDKPAGSYNADTHLFMSPDNLTMYLAYRERGVSFNLLRVMQTTDGLNWSAPATVLSGVTGVQDFASPSIWWNGTGWTCLSHNLDGGSPWPVKRSVSSTADIYGAWGAPSTVTIAPGAGRAWWHSFCLRLSSGQIVAIFQDNNGGAGNAGVTYWAESGDDGASFVVGRSVLRTLTAIAEYRSTFCVYRRESGLSVDAFMSNYTTRQVLKYSFAPGALAERRNHAANRAGLLASPASGNAAWVDTFDRTDSAASLGTASSGGTYTASTGIFGISGNKAYPVSAARVFAAVGSADHEVSVTMAGVTLSVQQWLIFRGVDASNYWRVGIGTPVAGTAQTVVLQSIVAGASVVNTNIGPMNVGGVLTARCVGGVLTVLADGERLHQRLMTVHLAGANIGMQASVGATTFLDNLVCVTY